MPSYFGGWIRNDFHFLMLVCIFQILLQGTYIVRKKLSIKNKWFEGCFFKSSDLFSFYWPHSRLCDLECLAQWTSYIYIEAHYTYRAPDKDLKDIPRLLCPSQSGTSQMYPLFWLLPPLVYVHKLFFPTLKLLILYWGCAWWTMLWWFQVNNIKIHVSFLPPKPLPSGWYNIEQSSMCYKQVFVIHLK